MSESYARLPVKAQSLERETGIEPATNSLEGCDSTTELLPPSRLPPLRQSRRFGGQARVTSSSNSHSRKNPSTRPRGPPPRYALRRDSLRLLACPDEACRPIQQAKSGGEG